jgi:hypothetical protein
MVRLLWGATCVVFCSSSWEVINRNGEVEKLAW